MFVAELGEAASVAGQKAEQEQCFHELRAPSPSWPTVCSSSLLSRMEPGRRGGHLRATEGSPLGQLDEEFYQPPTKAPSPGWGMRG